MWTPLGKPGFQGCQLRFDRADDLLGIRPIANDYDAAHDFLAVLVENAAAELRTQVHVRDIADVDGCAVPWRQRTMFSMSLSPRIRPMPRTISSGRLLL